MQPTTTDSSQLDDEAAAGDDHPVARKVMQELIGSRLICTLKDGRRTTGRLVCIDRLRNIILADCTEERIIESTDYAGNDKPLVRKKVSRHLQLAMIPGESLATAKVHKGIYQLKVSPHISS